MRAVTDAERLGWQFRALALLSELIDRAIAEHLPPLLWNIDTTGQLQGLFPGDDKRRDCTRWRDAIGNPSEEHEAFGGKRLVAVWSRSGHVRVVLTADLPDEPAGE